jgi:predicted RNA binding protein YcfA (HicA-like mRNA interferase family)
MVGRTPRRSALQETEDELSSAKALEAGLMERNSRKLIRMLEQNGWVLDRVNGDHHTFKHPEKEELITVTHPKKDLPTGLVRRIYKLAGWRS